MRKNKIKITNGLQKCVPYSDYTKAVWSDCTHLDCLQFKEIPCEQTLCQEKREGECKENFSFLIKIGEPFLRGITEFTYVIEKKDNSTNNSWKEVKREVIYLEGINQNLENYFKIISYDMSEDYDNIYGNIYYKISYSDNINNIPKTIQGIFECFKPSPPIPESNITIVGKGNLAMLTNDDEVIQVSVSNDSNPHFDSLYKEATFILEAFEDNQWVEKNRLISSEKSVGFTKSWRDVPLQELKFRSKIEVRYNYDYLQPSNLNTGEVILRKYQKPILQASFNFNNKTSLNRTQTEFTPNTLDYYIGMYIQCSGRISEYFHLFKHPSGFAFENKYSYDGITYLDSDFFRNGSDQNGVLSSSGFTEWFMGHNKVSNENSVTTYYKGRAIFEYKYDYLETDDLETGVHIVHINKTYRGTDKRCIEEMREGQLVKTNEVVYDNREILINGVVIRKEPNTAGPNHVPSYTDEVECRTEYLPKFDHLLIDFNYIIENNHFEDLDPAVGVESLGYIGCGQSGYIRNSNDGKMLYRGISDDLGITQGQAGEGFLINFENISEVVQPVNNVIEFKLFAGWCRQRAGKHDFNVSLTGYNGGIMERIGYTFRYQNVGGTKAFEKTFNINKDETKVGCCGSRPVDSGGNKAKVGVIYYNVITKDARLEIV